MNVRKTTGTTFSLIVLIVGVYFLLSASRHILPLEVLRLIDKRFYSQYYIGKYHSFLQFVSAWLIVVVGIVDVILNNRVNFALRFSFNIPIILSIPMIIFIFIPLINAYLFWGLIYVILILGVFWTFKKFITNNHNGRLKLIPFIKEIMNGVGSGSNHISDRYIVFGISILLIGVYTLLLVSFVIYVITYWSMFG